LKSGEYHAAAHPRPPADKLYLDGLARRLADAAGLPLALAQRRVQALAISTAPRPKCGGFGDRE
jgi:hypothetical protein